LPRLKKFSIVHPLWPLEFFVSRPR